MSQIRLETLEKKTVDPLIHNWKKKQTGLHPKKEEAGVDSYSSDIGLNSRKKGKSSPRGHPGVGPRKRRGDMHKSSSQKKFYHARRGGGIKKTKNKEERRMF